MGCPFGCSVRGLCLAVRGGGQGWAPQKLSKDSRFPLTSSLGFLGLVGAARRPGGRRAVAAVGRCPAVPAGLGNPEECSPWPSPFPGESCFGPRFAGVAVASRCSPPSLGFLGAQVEEARAIMGFPSTGSSGPSGG